MGQACHRHRHYSPLPPHLPLLSPTPATVTPAAVAGATASAVATPPILLSSSPPLLLSSSPPPLSPSLLPLHAVAAAVAASPTAVVLLLLCNARKAAAWQRRHQTRWQPGQAGLGCMVWATMQMQGPNHCRGITCCCCCCCIAYCRWWEEREWGWGGRGGKGQQEQNAPRAKKCGRAPPRAVPRW